jgi:hypothetical protein
MVRCLPTILNMVESCAKRMRLLIVWQSAMEVYSIAVAEQSRQAGIASKAEYERLAGAAEGARQYVQEVRGILKAHISAHGCNRAKAAA